MLYVLANVAYFAAVPAAEIKKSGTLVAALFFSKARAAHTESSRPATDHTELQVFGETAGARVLPALVSLSAFGNLIAVLGESCLPCLDRSKY